MRKYWNLRKFGIQETPSNFGPALNATSRASSECTQGRTVRYGTGGARAPQALGGGTGGHRHWGAC